MSMLSLISRKRRLHTSDSYRASDMDDCLYILESVGIVTLMQRRQLERF